LTKPASLDFLRQVSLFKELSEPHLVAVSLRLRERRLRNGEVLFREGDPGQELFLIREGSVVISKPVVGRVEQVLARLGPGDFFGEMSLFDQFPRSATVQAETETVLLSLDREHLHQLIELSPAAATAFFYRLVQVFIQRLRETSNLVAEVTRWGLEATGLDVEHKFPG
jgi:CRP-like cAMP-binding protein